MAPRKQGGLAQSPSFDPHIFQFGQHLGSQPDLNGFDASALLQPDWNQNIWNGPYQNPYGGGSDPYAGMTGGTANGLQMGQNPGYDPSAAPQGAPGPVIGGDPSMGGVPPPDHPAAIGHPFWKGVGNYLQSDGFKDSLMGGIIAGQLASNPQAALQYAMQWRAHKDQRAWQAQQNDQNREAAKERFAAQQQMMKERDAAKQEEEKQKEFVRKGLQFEAKAVQAGYDTNGAVADLGPLTPDNYDDHIARLNAFNAKTKADKLTETQANKTFTQQRQAIGDMFQGKPYGKTPWDGTPEWDSVRAQAEALGKQRLDFNTKLKSQRINIEGLNETLKRLDVKQQVAEGGTKSLKFKEASTELSNANKHLNDVENDIDAYTKGSKTPLGNIDYSAEIAAKKEELGVAQQRYQDALDNARTLASGKPVDLLAPSPETKTGLTADDIAKLKAKRAAALGASVAPTP